MMQACSYAGAQGAAAAAVVPRAASAQSAARRPAGAAQSSSSSSLGGVQFLGLRRIGGHALKTEWITDSFADLRRSVCDENGAPASRGVVTAMAGTGKFFVGGNWKCNGTRESVKKLVEDLNGASISDDVDVVVAPPFVYLDQVLGSITNRIEVSAQNCWVGKGGAFTGEVSAEMLKDIGLNWVILGHSERRQLIGETNEFVGKKEEYALNSGLKVIGCIGETLEERESGRTIEVVSQQLAAMREHLPSWENVVIAYEPVWAIGTGKVATPAQAQDVHEAIRKWLADNVSAVVASATRIIYGGSVNAKNCEDLAREEDIDGFLVGGASLIGPDFATIVNSVNAKKVAA